jgi:hypothetical protein
MTGEEHDDSREKDDRQVTLPAVHTFNLTTHLGIAGKQGQDREREKGSMLKGKEKKEGEEMEGKDGKEWKNEKEAKKEKKEN